GEDHRPGEERRRWRRRRSPGGAGARHPGAGGRCCRGRDRRRASAGRGNQRFVRGRRADGEAVKGAVGERWRRRGPAGRQQPRGRRGGERGGGGGGVRRGRKEHQSQAGTAAQLQAQELKRVVSRKFLWQFTRRMHVLSWQEGDQGAEGKWYRGYDGLPEGFVPNVEERQARFPSVAEDPGTEVARSAAEIGFGRSSPFRFSPFFLVGGCTKCRYA
ncbi:unnamed protein product, partial [Ectocarpus sp. 12 AP-2014]